MSKFLNLVENTMPSAEDEAQNKMVDVLAELLNKIPSIDVISTSKPEELKISINGSEITLHVTNVTNNGATDEDNEMKVKDYDLDRGVEGLAAKANSGISGAVAGMFGSPYQKAKKAVKRRLDASIQGIDVYNKVTDNLISAIQNSKKASNTTWNVI